MKVTTPVFGDPVLEVRFFEQDRWVAKATISGDKQLAALRTILTWPELVDVVMQRSLDPQQQGAGGPVTFQDKIDPAALEKFNQIVKGEKRPEGS